MKKVLIALLVLAAAGGGVYWKQTQSQAKLPEGIASVNGRLTVDRVDVATLYVGRVEEILVKEGEDVEKNQALARLSSSQIESQVNATSAQIKAMLAQVAQAKAQKQRALETVSRASAEINAQQQQLSVAKLELDNAKKLRRDSLISASELERRQANYKVAQSAIETAKAARAEAQATVSQADATISQAQAMVERAKADAQNAQSQNEDMLIRSPLSGRVEYQLADVGNVLGVGGKVVSILDLDDVYINVFLPSYQANQVKIGDEARVIVDGVEAVFPAKISYVSSQAQFTPKSVETAEERTKMMFKIKLQIPEEIVKQNPAFFKGGMTAMGYVKYDNKAEWSEALNVKLPSEK